MQSEITQRAILVTGGAGYIGSHVCKLLARQGYLPVSLDNLVYGHEWAVKWGPLEVGSLADIGFLASVMQKYRPIAVLHFAAYAYVGESVTDPAKYYSNNVTGTLALLDVCRSFGIDKFVFSSTCATYGIPQKVPISEAQPQDPVNPYGASKLMIERILKDYDHAYGLRSVSLRYFNAAGADPDNEIGEHHDPETHLIPLVLDAAAGMRPHITIFGEDYPTTDGTCIRDYIHVTDLATAHLNALELLLDGGETTVLNLGTGAGNSVREVVEMAERVTGRKVPVIVGARRAGDPPELVADPTRATRILGWTPMHSSLREILETAWKWHQTVMKPNTSKCT